MLDDPRLLVVDDEEAICEGCRRIFTRQGFQVEKTSDALEGLALAAERDYAAILLDIKMPNMDGIQFLEQLRSKKPSVPVILMTGYPSIPNAVSAVRLGAAGYVTKPFTPEEITQAVHKYVPAREVRAQDKPTGESWTPPADGLCFWQESWLDRAADGSVRTGALATRSQLGNVERVVLPRIGEVVYQGLPLAAVYVTGKAPRILPAPVSGVVLAANDKLAQEPNLIVNDPCDAGWIATLSPTRLEEELSACSHRPVILFNGNPTTAATQRVKLAALGCQVRVVSCWDELADALKDSAYQVLVMEAAQSGPEGPAMVGQINAVAPQVKVILVASPGNLLETAYRSRRIFYYAVEPFADNEIAEILDAAFRPQTGAAPAARRSTSDGISTISITNRNGTKVRLMAAPGLLHRDEGLGQQIRQKLLGRLFPIETTAGDAKVDPAHIVQSAATCDRLIVLLAKDAGRLPGCLVRDTKSEFVSVSGEGAGKVTTLVVQVDAETGALDLYPRTMSMLAEHVVNDMASY